MVQQLDVKKFLTSAKANKKRNAKLFAILKKVKPKQLDTDFHTLHHDAFSCIDCLSCANCCKTTGPLFTTQDIDRISKHLKLSTSVFIETYLKIDEDGDFVLKQLPCPFLAPDNYCGIYEARPKACRTYPHTNQNGMHTILDLTKKNASICPAVGFIADKLQEKYL